MNRNPKLLPMPPPAKSMLSVMEAAALSGLGRNTIYDLIKGRVAGKKLPSKRIGKRWLIRRVDLDKFLTPDAT